MNLKHFHKPRTLKERQKLALDYLGIRLDKEKAKIIKIYDGLVRQSGLRYLPNCVEYEIASIEGDCNSKFDDKNRLTTWHFTEINCQPISLRCSNEVFLNSIFNNDKIIFIVQPGDLIKNFKKELKKIQQKSFFKY